MINESELPAGWQLCRIADVCTVNPSKREITDTPDDIGVTFVPMAAVDEATRTIKEPETRLLGEVRRGYTYFAEGDVLFAKITPSMENGKAAIARGLENGLGMGSTEFHVLRPGRNVMAEWIYRYIEQPWFRDLAASHFTGSVGQQRVPRDFIENHKLPLPPLPEQRRIVARIEELTERIDATRRLRVEAAEGADAIMPSTLAEVFRKAEEKWWEKHRLADVTLIGTPRGWKPIPKDGKIPFIEMANIDQETGLNSSYVWADYDKVSKGKVKFQADAILVAKITPCTENNKTALAPEIPTDGGFATTEVFAVHPTGFTNRLYLLAFLRSPQVRVELVSSMTGSTGRQRVPKDVLENLEMPLPSLDEQCRVVEYLDTVQAKVEAIRRYQEETRQEIEAMTGAVLERAFRGEL